MLDNSIIFANRYHILSHQFNIYGKTGRLDEIRRTRSAEEHSH